MPGSGGTGQSPGPARARLPGNARRGRRGETAVYLGRRQEVGPERGSGRLEREHGAAACSARPVPVGARDPPPDARWLRVPRAAARARSAASRAGWADGCGHG